MSRDENWQVASDNVLGPPATDFFETYGSEFADGGSQSVKAVFCDPVTGADLLLSGPVVLYEPAAGEAVIALYVAAFALPESAGIIVAPDIPFGTTGTAFAAVDSGLAYDSAMFAAIANGQDGALAAVTEPLLVGPSTDPANGTGGAAFTRPWQAATVYGTGSPQYSVAEAGTFWANLGSEGTSGVSKPDFAGNLGGSVADGADIVWNDAGDDISAVSLTAILLVAVAP